MRLDSRLLPALFGAIVVIVACSDSTRPRLQSPLVGQWELTTHFDTFSFETGAPSPPDCVYADMYCTHFRTTTDGAYLAGVIELQDATSSTDTVTKTVLASGMVQTRFCDQVDYNYTTAVGCLHVSDLATVSYAGQITGPPDSTATQALDVVIGEPGNVFGGNITMRSHDATYAGDSIYGKLYWGQSGGRSPPTYRGTFVLRRVK
ncbi:MAG TPA: hypothetical protein VFY85_06300 [Gemmatimonadaceae bacterium]|nr:hypothetical protein [Gemmatimonadaceae bacterium]